MRHGMKVVLCLCLLPAVCGFYLPGTAANYNDGELVPMDANVLTSIHTHLPFEYYSLAFPRMPGYPQSVTKVVSENIGEILLADRIRKSPYDQVKMNVNFNCKVAQDVVTLSEPEKKLFEERIKDEYIVQLILDGLPVSVQNVETNSFSVGFPVGARENNNFILYNHLDFTVKYSTTTITVDNHEKAVKRIVAFTVKPYSVAHTIAADGKTVESCTESYDPAKSLPVTTTANQIAFTYAVRWEATEDRWATRWDPYLQGSDSEIHWFSIVNSLMIVLFLTGMVAVIMMRTLRKDISRYNAEDQEEIQEETGWKLCHRDVFRPPAGASMLACYTGTGVQLIGMAITVLLFACFGFLSPANRGALFTALLLCFVFLGIYGGYTAARFMHMWNRPSWQTTAMTALLVPGEIFALFFIINLFVWFQRSSAAVPFGTFMALIALWVCISAPLVFVGSILGYKKEPIKLPVKTSQLARHIPEQPMYMRAPFTIMMGGILPFGAVFIELFFILTSIWLNRYYYVFGFLLLVFLILVVTCAEITIVMIYFQLCSEDYNWWWRSYLTAGSSGGYLFLYSIFYFFTSSFKMKRFVSILLFFGYMGIISYIFFVLTGTMGFLACFMFVRKIYSSIKVD